MWLGTNLHMGSTMEFQTSFGFQGQRIATGLETKPALATGCGCGSPRWWASWNCRVLKKPNLCISSVSHRPTYSLTPHIPALETFPKLLLNNQFNNRPKISEELKSAADYLLSVSCAPQAQKSCGAHHSHRRGNN